MSQYDVAVALLGSAGEYGVGHLAAGLDSLGSSEGRIGAGVGFEGPEGLSAVRVVALVDVPVGVLAVVHEAVVREVVIHEGVAHEADLGYTLAEVLVAVPVGDPAAVLEAGLVGSSYGVAGGLGNKVEGP